MNISPVDALNRMTYKIFDEIEADGTFAHYFILIEQSFKLKDKFPQIQQIFENNLKLINKAAEFIEKGQRTRQFAIGDAYQMAILYFSIVQGIINMKFILEDKFEMPNIKMVTAFLLRDVTKDYL